MLAVVFFYTSDFIRTHHDGSISGMDTLANLVFSKSQSYWHHPKSRYHDLTVTAQSKSEQELGNRFPRHRFYQDYYLQSVRLPETLISMKINYCEYFFPNTSCSSGKRSAFQNPQIESGAKIAELSSAAALGNLVGKKPSELFDSLVYY